LTQALDILQRIQGFPLDNAFTGRKLLSHTSLAELLHHGKVTSHYHILLLFLYTPFIHLTPKNTNRNCAFFTHSRVKTIIFSSLHQMREYSSTVLPLVCTVCVLFFHARGEGIKGTSGGYTSAVGDPGMRRDGLRLAWEAWNFCNEVGEEAPHMGSPRGADCFDLGLSFFTKLDFYNNIFFRLIDSSVFKLCNF
jgi:hypothetical protein